MPKMKTLKQPHLPILPNGKDEMNLAEFPFALLSKRVLEDKETIEFNDIIEGKDRQPIKREWTVTGSDKFGLPLAGDEELYVALMKLTKDDGFQSRTINFTKYKLMKIMGWSNQGRNYSRIEEGLKRLKGVSIYAKNAFWDNKAKAYATVSFGIIDNFILYGERSGRNQESSLPSSCFSWNEVLFNSFQAGFIKTLDVDFYFSLGSSVSKRLYRFLDKNRYRKSRFEIGLLKLSAILPIQDQYPSQIRRRLNSTHNELIKRGFLSSITYKKGKGGEEKVVYEFSEELPPKSKTAELSGGLSFQISGESANILQWLEERGITKKVANVLVKNYTPNLIQKQIEIFNWLRERKSPLVNKNPAGFLRKSIEENYEPPKEYLDQYERRGREREENDRKQRWLKHREKLIKQDIEDWNMIPPVERVSGRLGFWITCEKLNNRLPTEEQIKTMRQELIDNLPKNDEEKWEHLSLNYPEDPPDEFE